MTPLLLQALAGEEVPRPPLWMFRQAGRFLPEYRALREKTDFATLCATPELAAEATLQPIRRFGFDAAIVFSDLLVVLEGLGFRIAYAGAGPVVENPPQRIAELQRLPDFEALPQVCAPARTLEILRRELPEEVGRIGFSGAPWTVGLYLLEGKTSKSFVKARGAARENPAAFRCLLEQLADGIFHYLRLQVEGGAQVLQIFDSWAGLTAPRHYEELAGQANRRLLQKLSELQVPVLWFVRGSHEHCRNVAEYPLHGLSVDYTVELPELAREVSADLALQGNLDPATLLTTPQQARKQTQELLRAMQGRRRYVVNLGHGIDPATRIDCVEAVVRCVQESSLSLATSSSTDTAARVS